MILNQLHNIEDLRNLSKDELPTLAKELRQYIIHAVATKAGHLGASLGVVELTIALHYLFKTPKDKLIWDVGHQAYGHKILTGRKNVFDTNRQLHGISGFPKISESPFDAFGTGHSSTSISAILGMAKAAQLRNENRQHIAVIGDASIVSGMAFEALNHASVSGANVLIILNDNGIGIDWSVGALKEHFKNLSPNSDQNIFKALGLFYTGPIDGHDLPVLMTALEDLKNIPGPKLLHVKTVKGKGLKQAELDQVTYHAPGKFDSVTGELFQKSNLPTPPKFQDVFGYTLLELAKTNEKIIGITPAMPSGSSLKYMMAEIPERAFDVGIAEQHAVTFSAGLAADGFIPYCNIYSTFLQRGYDQVIHDVALQNLPVIFCLDRAGLVGEDGATHHGIFDIAYLRSIPNLIFFAPRNEEELRNILFTVQLELKAPIAIRYPRGRGRNINWESPFQSIEIGKGICLRQGEKLAIISLGTMAYNVEDALSDLTNLNIGHYDMRFIKPLDTDILHEIFNKFQSIITVEDGIISGGFGSAILEFANEHDYTNRIKILGVPDQFIEQGTIPELQKICGIDTESIKNCILKELNYK
ncbi:1-deoxy-D-xylulose-5-phosphate synthase [Mangrovimonas futianensis]|uniref:1-deoxy-D-xylulose-5-phosphate synthase n=1 Tax=Mangrovimonas futianensis TaxID=2895523 RepID=UPI001E36AB3E|nr:1-deoxy-D-xylulose-5-phosphate synthase [Mangrovimonas futianensis]MCF1421732.1 1-deoxy-D-xylulose-5-phosphate synthase [Mangrovimonas futianensis]